MFKYFLYIIAQFIVSILPRKWAYGLGIFLADVVYLFSFRDRKLVRDNLKYILGPEQKKDIRRYTREVFRNFGRYLVEFFSINNDADLEYVQNNVVIKNIEHLDRALEAKRGCVILTAHIGNWELGAIILSLLGYPLTAIALPHKEREVNSLFNKKRESKGMEVVPVHHAINRCYEALGENRAVALLADRDFTQSGEPIELFGFPAKIPKGAALFCLKGKCPIVPAFLVRDKENKFTLEICEPINRQQFHKGFNERENMLEIMNQYTRVIEERIRKNPTQWLMFQKFWTDSFEKKTAQKAERSC